MKVIFMPYCNFATRGDSEMKLNIFRFILKGMGMMRPMKSAISPIRRANTWSCVRTFCSGLSLLKYAYQTVVEGHDCGWE